MKFEFWTPTQIIFGLDTLPEAVPVVQSLGKHPLLVTGKVKDRAGGLASALSGAGLDVDHFSVDGEPAIEMIREGVVKARESQRDVVVGFGGGSALDAAKAIAGLAPNSGDILDYLEVIGKGRALGRPALPIVTIPTTAGTGAEITKNAVLGSPADHVKVSLRSVQLLPRTAVVDPRLTVSMPPSVTAYSGLDALTQVIEPFLTRRHNPFVDALCREAIPRAARSLKIAFRNPDDLEARQNMSFASLVGGVALTNAGLGAVHGFAGPLGGMTGAPHGAICARLLPAVLEANYRALYCAGNPEGKCDRLDEIGRLLAGHSSAQGKDAVRWLRECCSELGIPSLSHWGLTRGMIDEAVEKARRASSMKGNPVLLSPSELRGILEQSID